MKGFKPEFNQGHAEADDAARARPGPLVAAQSLTSSVLLVYPVVVVVVVVGISLT